MFWRDLGKISPKGTTDGRPTFRLHYLAFLVAQPVKVDIAKLGLQLCLNSPHARAHAPSSAESGARACLGEIWAKSRPNAPRTAVQHPGFII